MTSQSSLLAVDGSNEDYQQLSEGQTRRRSRYLWCGIALACVAAVALITGDSKQHLLRGAEEPTSLAAASPKFNITLPRPIFLMHGIRGSASSFDHVVGWLREASPDTLLFPLKLYEGDDSIKASLTTQLNAMAADIQGIIGVKPEAFEAGYDLVCHSQGALLCRVYCQVVNDHKVHTLISLAGPHMGVYGETWFKEFDPAPAIPGLPSFVPNMFESAAYQSFHTVAYSSAMQSSTSVANLWHDPLHEDEFLQDNTFLPFVNGLTGDGVPAGMKANFLRLRKAVFLVGSFTDRDYDSPIGLEPWCTGAFSFYAAGSKAGSPCVPMQEQDVFTKDTFGLKSLHDAGRLHVQSVKNVAHGDWLKSAYVFSKYVLPHMS